MATKYAIVTVIGRVRWGLVLKLSVVGLLAVAVIWFWHTTWPSAPFWHRVGIVSIVVVVIGVLGEHLEEHGLFSPATSWRQKIKKLASSVVILGLAVELLATARYTGLEEQESEQLNTRADQAVKQIASEGGGLIEAYENIRATNRYLLHRYDKGLMPWRVYMPEQRMILVDQLRTFGLGPSFKAEVVLVSPSVDSVHLSQDIAGMLKDVGWDAQWVNGIGTADRFGVWVFCPYGRDTKQGKAAAELAILLHEYQEVTIPGEPPFLINLVMPDKSATDPSTMPCDKIAPTVIKINDEDP
jgi:hypothetical protein